MKAGGWVYRCGNRPQDHLINTKELINTKQPRAGENNLALVAFLDAQPTSRLRRLRMGYNRALPGDGYVAEFTFCAKVRLGMIVISQDRRFLTTARGLSYGNGAR